GQTRDGAVSVIVPASVHLGLRLAISPAGPARPSVLRDLSVWDSRRERHTSRWRGCPEYRYRLRRNASRSRFSAAVSDSPNVWPGTARFVTPGGFQPFCAYSAGSRAGSNISSRVVTDPS